MKGKIIWGIILLIMIIYVIWYYSEDESSEEKNDLASCLKRKGVKFYGASYCGYCNKQKQMFGDDAKNLPYIECESPKNPECTDENITGYPTWIFPDGKRLTGQVSIEQLKEHSQCL